MNKKALLGIMLMVLAMVVGGVARSKLRAHRYAQPAFTLISRVTHFNPTNAGQQLHGEETTYVFSDGSYRVVFDGEPDAKGFAPQREYFFKYGAGFFEVDSKQKQLIRNSKMPPNARGRRPLTAEELLSDPQSIRTAPLLPMPPYA